MSWNWRAMGVQKDDIMAQAYNFASYNEAYNAAKDHMKNYPANQYYIEVYEDSSVAPPPPGVQNGEGVGGDRGGGASGTADVTNKLNAALTGQEVDWQTWAAIATVASVIIMIIVLVLTRGKAGA